MDVHEARERIAAGRSADPRLVVAVGPATRDRLARILAGWPVRYVASLDGLTQALDLWAHELVIVSSRFDHSQALHALEQALKRTDRPVVCVRGIAQLSPLGEASVQALRVAARELGVACFIDLNQFADDAAGDARVRAMLEQLNANPPAPDWHTRRRGGR